MNLHSAGAQIDRFYYRRRVLVDSAPGSAAIFWYKCEMSFDLNMAIAMFSYHLFLKQLLCYGQCGCIHGNLTFCR